MGRFALPRDSVGLGDGIMCESVGGVLPLGTSSVCLSAYCDMSERVDMNEAVRRLRSRFDGCESSLGIWRPANAPSELRPKMLRRLSLDMVYRVARYAPPHARSAVGLSHAEGTESGGWKGDLAQRRAVGRWQQWVDSISSRRLKSQSQAQAQAQAHQRVGGCRDM